MENKTKDTVKVLFRKRFKAPIVGKFISQKRFL